MTTETLMDAIGLLPSDLVTQADQWRNAKKTRVIQWKRWAAMAACLILVLGAALVISRLGVSTEKAASMAAPQAPGAPAMDTAIMEESILMETPSEEKTAENGAGELTWPLALSLSWEGGTAEVWPGNYELRTDNPDGTRNETIACGPYPPDADLEPVKTDGQVTLIWAQAPDTVTVRCWKDTGEEGTAMVRDGILTVDPEYPIYEITARWGETCTASYAAKLHLN